MKDFNYFMPTKVYFGKDCVLKNAEVFKQFGKKAIILTGRSSAKNNGSQADVVKALESSNINYIVFDQIEENPSVSTIEKATAKAVEEKADFVIGIGGGSPMDSAKAVAFLACNPDKPVQFLFEKGQSSHLPVVETYNCRNRQRSYTVCYFNCSRKENKNGYSQKDICRCSIS